MGGLNEIIHQAARLKIMAALAALDEDARVDFNYLKRLLELTDGNLGAHLQRLEEAGYLALEKTFVDRKPRTYLRLTPGGREAFREHVKALRAILDPQA